MGFHLYREIMRYAPESLTHKEKLAALAIADDANDVTRLTWNTPYDPEILRQAKVKSADDMKKVLRKLKAAGVIESVVEHAHRGTSAKFRFLPLGPAVDNPVETPVDNPEEGGSIQPPIDETPEWKGGQIHPPVGPNGGVNPPEWGADFTPPTPLLTPHKISSSSSAAPTTGEEDEMISEEKTQTPVADFVTEAAARHIVDRQVGIDRDQARAVVALLGREAASRGKPVGAWHRYIARFSDDQLRDALGRIQAAQRPAQSASPALPPKCDDRACGPDRRVETPDGKVAPCPRCHPSVVGRAAHAG